MNKSLEPKPSSTNSVNSTETSSTPKNHVSQPPITSVMAFSGPIPPPDYLGLYEKLVPGSAKRFLEEPHLEAEHRRALENLSLNQQINLSKRGQWMAFSLAFFCITAAFAAIFSGYDIAGLGALIASITAFVGVFIYGKYQGRR